jgi:quinol monooxygenase YgiN
MDKYVDSVKKFVDNHPLQLAVATAAFLGGMIVTTMIHRNFDHVAARRVTKEKGAFVLLVTIDFQNEIEKEDFKTIFRPMADYVAEYERSTVSYEIAESDKNEKRVCIIERYINKASYSNIHRSSKEFLEYKQKLKELDSEGKMTIHGHSYIETNIGFI